jgi:hypothetical protein
MALINPKSPNWKYYGARGIQVCWRWHKSNPDAFSNFVSDMGTRPSHAYSIDRINNDGHYMPSNCRWATKSQQMNNMRGPRRTHKPRGKPKNYSKAERARRARRMRENQKKRWLKKGTL